VDCSGAPGGAALGRALCSRYFPSYFGIWSIGTHQGACSDQKILAWGLIPGSESNSPLGTTQNWLLRLIFGRTEPQFLQKRRVKPGFSLSSTNRSIKFSPRVHDTESRGKARFATWTEPLDFWHERQWQYKKSSGFPLTSNATLPHKQDAISVFIMLFETFVPTGSAPVIPEMKS
jgi:hypothetical protein